MATADQIKSLIRSHLSEDDERFFTVALQVAAHEAMLGHGEVAHDIRLIIDQARKSQGAARILKFPPDLLGLVLEEEPQLPLSALVASPAFLARIERIKHEYLQQSKLKSYGLVNRRKILLIGPPGTGKTMTARVLAHELQLHLFTIQVHKLVTKFMGETSAQLRILFDLVRDVKGLYFFDEFDAIGGERSLDNDVGEMRRVLNSFLQFIEQDTSDSLILAASNSPQLLDRALYRRFDDVLYYTLPEPDEREKLIRNVLGTFWHPSLELQQIGAAADGLSHAEIDSACRDAIKSVILSGKDHVSTSVLMDMITERQEAHWPKKG